MISGAYVNVGDCHVEGCTRPARSDGKCWTHVKRRQRGKPLDAPVKARRRPGAPDIAELADRLQIAALAYADADAEDDAAYDAAWCRLQAVAAAHWRVRAVAAGWRPPARPLSKRVRRSRP